MIPSICTALGRKFWDNMRWSREFIIFSIEKMVVIDNSQQYNRFGGKQRQPPIEVQVWIA